MWSEYSLDVVDAVARHGSFSAAAQELHRVPSAISYTVRQLEEWLAVPLFVRRLEAFGVAADDEHAFASFLRSFARILRKF